MLKCPNNKNCKKLTVLPLYQSHLDIVFSALSIVGRLSFRAEQYVRQIEKFDFNFSNKDNKFELISGAPMRG